jgi:hypothetical protein
MTCSFIRACLTLCLGDLAQSAVKCLGSLVSLALLVDFAYVAYLSWKFWKHFEHIGERHMAYEAKLLSIFITVNLGVAGVLLGLVMVMSICLGA